MTEVRFYHLERQSQVQILPLLLSKAYDRGHKIVVKMCDKAEVERMNEHLWTFQGGSFLPHGSVKNGDADVQPVWLTDADENPNKADVLILCADVESDIVGDFDLCCEMLNGQNPNSVSAARARWKVYKEAGYEVTYWQQGENGGWEKKA